MVVVLVTDELVEKTSTYVGSIGRVHDKSTVEEVGGLVCVDCDDRGIEFEMVSSSDRCSLLAHVAPL